MLLSGSLSLLYPVRIVSAAHPLAAYVGHARVYSWCAAGCIALTFIDVALAQIYRGETVLFDFLVAVPRRQRWSSTRRC